MKEIADNEKTLLSGLRAQIHAWFQEIMPEIHGLRDPNLPLTESQDFAMRRRYAELLARDGWAGLAWDTHWGGQGAAFAERLVFADEAAQFDAPDPLSRLGVDIIGPTINVLGTEEQKAMFLPDILAAVSPNLTQVRILRHFAPRRANQKMVLGRSRVKRSGPHLASTPTSAWCSREPIMTHPNIRELAPLLFHCRCLASRLSRSLR